MLSLFSRVSESLFISLSYRESFFDVKVCVSYWANDQLCNAFAILYGIGFCAMIDEEDYDFAAIVAIYRTRGIEYGDAVFSCKSASWSYLSLKSEGNFERYARRNSGICTTGQSNGLG